MVGCQWSGGQREGEFLGPPLEMFLNLKCKMVSFATTNSEVFLSLVNKTNVFNKLFHKFPWKFNDLN